MKHLVSFAIRYRTALTVVAAVVTIAVMTIAGGAPAIFSP